MASARLMRLRSRLKLAANGDYPRTRPVFEKVAEGNHGRVAAELGFRHRVRAKTP